ncbi:MAG: preprotein translocase subunit SecG [Flavobacteriales bacterium]|nr:preprotein translocase subunit SecG [Flavobacteriales bacterium]
MLGLVVLIQNPKGGGLSSGFAGSAQIGGVKRTADFLEKATWYLGIALFVLCLASTSLSTSARPATEEEQQTEQAEGGQQQGGDQQQGQ